MSYNAFSTQRVEQGSAIPPTVMLMTDHVFISYSRKDYYFAESLAFHLERHSVETWLDAKDLVPGEFWERKLIDALGDVDVVLLVASAAAFKSAHVEKEWRWALQNGKRIILINWPARTKPPAELKDIEAVDFRGSFGAALSRLLDVIRGGEEVTRGITSRWPRFPPWVLIISAALMIPVLGYAFVVYPETRLDDPEMLAMGIARPLQAILLVVFSGALIWWLCVSFIQRRMGMTRLMVCLTAVAIPFVWPLIVLHKGGPEALATWPPLAAQLIVRYWLWVAAFGAVPISAALAVLFWRPEDLLRWMPTGKGWQSHRVGHVVTATDAVIAAHSFESIDAFRLLCDPVDDAAATKLGEQLEQFGSRQVDDHSDVENAVNVLLVTNRTQPLWLESRAKDLHGTVITVVGTAIALPKSLDRLWRRQWLDYRRWDLRTEEREQGLPSIPETVQNLRVPKVVTVMHGLLCAYAALLFLLGGETSPENNEVSEAVSAVASMSPITAILGLAMLYPASKFLARAMARSQLRHWLTGAVLGGTVFGIISLHQLWLMHGAGIEVITGFIGLVTMPMLGWRQLNAVDFWLPATSESKRKRREKDKASREESLNPGGNWRTLLTFVLIVFVWSIFIGHKISLG